MNRSHRLLVFAFILMLPVRLDLLAAAAGAEPAGAVDGLRVQGLLGRAQVARGGAEFVPLAPGAILQAGDVVRTANGSALDISLGKDRGFLRLTEATVISVEKAAAGKAEAPGGLEVSLRSGEVLAQCKPLPSQARLEVKTVVGIAEVLSGRVRIQARGYIVVTEGKVLFAHVPVGGEPAAHTLTAPPACYFTPSAGVQPAPKDLVREVKKQFQAKVPSK